MGSASQKVAISARTPGSWAILLTALAFLCTAASAQDAARTVTDSAGRRVDIPEQILRVLAAGPPASILLYTLAPEKMIGWVRSPSLPEKAFLLPEVRDLPEYGRLTGRGTTANLENVLKFKPDLVLDVGSLAPTYISLADAVQDQTRIPYLLLDGKFDSTPQIYRMLGQLLGVTERGKELARYAEETLIGLKARIASIAQDKRPRVYYARGVDGLETGLAGSINLEVLDKVGAVNVAAAAGSGGLTRVSLEQILAWDPDLIVTLEPAFYKTVGTDPAWSSVAAVRHKRIYLAPRLPYGWFDAPPGVNRLIGVRWLMSILYPKEFPEDLRDTTKNFYKLFYHVDLSEAQIDTLLTMAIPAR